MNPFGEWPKPPNVAIGSKNPCKVETARAVLRRYEMFDRSIVLGAQVESGVSVQPRGLREMREGAENRARAARLPLFQYGIGLESGIFYPHDTHQGAAERELPIAGLPLLDACFCAILGPDGRFHHGMSAAFPIPPRLVELMETDDCEMSTAIQLAGWGEADIKLQGGVISLFTGGAMTREQQVEQALICALAPIVSPQWW